MGNAIAPSLVRSLAPSLRLIPVSPHSRGNSLLSVRAAQLHCFPSFLCALSAPAFQFRLFSIPKRPNHSRAQARQALCQDSLPPIAQQYPAAIGHSRCRHRHSSAPSRALVPLQSGALPALSLFQTWLRLKSSPSIDRPLLRAASRKRELRNEFLVQQEPLPKLAPLPAPAAPAFRLTAQSCAPASRATPLAPSLPQKKPGQAIVDCASEEPTPAPEPGGRSCAGETASHLSSHALRRFARRVNTFCLPAKFR